MRILVVEDELFLAMELDAELRSQGYDVVGPANTLEEAHALLAEARIDVAVLDANLRGQTPSTLAEELRRRGLPFLYLSGYDEAFIRAHLPEAPLLSKPLQIDALARHLDELAGSAGEKADAQDQRSD